MQVVVLFARSHLELQEKAQAWADRHPSVRITNVALSSGNHGHCLTLVGTEGASGPAQITLLFERTGVGVSPAEALSQSLQRALAQRGAPAFLAQSGNEAGHLICLVHQ